MPQPRLTFACELEPALLQALFSDPAVVTDLLALHAGVSLGILDHSAERAEVVRCLNQAGIPLVAWLLLPKDEGYWFGLDNAPQAAGCYAAFKAWSAEQGLRWSGIGVDIETDYGQMQALMTGRRREVLSHLLGIGVDIETDYGQMQALMTGHRREVLSHMLGWLLDNERLRRAQLAYGALLAQMRADGYTVESYQFPFIVDERAAGSTLVQRIFGIVDVPADREVLMLYSSFLGSAGPAFLWSYAADAGGAGVGSTGGGVESALPVLDWDGLARDLRLAYRRAPEVFVFSLEGCVRQGFLVRLGTFDWDAPLVAPEGVEQVNAWRRALRAGLGASAHPWAVLGAALILGRAAGWVGGSRRKDARA